MMFAAVMASSKPMRKSNVKRSKNTPLILRHELKRANLTPSLAAMMKFVAPFRCYSVERRIIPSSSVSPVWVKLRLLKGWLSA